MAELTKMEQRFMKWMRRNNRREGVWRISKNRLLFGKRYRNLRSGSERLTLWTEKF